MNEKEWLAVQFLTINPYICTNQKAGQLRRPLHPPKINNMRKFASFYSMLFVLAAGIVAGSLQSCQGSMKHIVGADRDDHGCIASAGYTWSYALHDCVRIWEVGEELSYGQNTISLVFSTDSLFAELFGKDDFHVICRKKKRRKPVGGTPNGREGLHPQRCNYCRNA